MDTQEHGDRQGDRRHGVADRRLHNDPRGRDARRLGPCRECGIETEHVAIWNGSSVRLCVDCSSAIRVGGIETDPTSPHGWRFI